MSKQLYEEALAEVRQLKQIAEDNAKRAIMEEVTPRIKQLIESQLLDPTAGSTDEINEVDEPVDSTGDLNEVDDPTDGSTTSDEKVFEVSPVVEGIMRKLVNSQPRRLNEFRLLTYKLGRRVCENKSQRVNYDDLLETLKTVYVLLQENIEPSEERQKIEETLDKYYQLALTKQENFKMNLGRGRKLNEASLKVDIDGLPDDLLDGIDWDENPPTVTLSPASEEEEGEMGGEEGEDLDFDADDEGGDELPPADDMGGEEGDMGDEDVEESYAFESTNELAEDTVVEIDESMLRNEIAKMKKLREARSAAPVEKKSVAGKKMTPKVLSAFGGGKDEGDPWLDGEVTTESLDEIEEGWSDINDCSESDVVESGTENSLTRVSGSVPTPGARRAANESRINKLQEARQVAVAKGRKARRVMESARKAGNKAVYLEAKNAYAAASAQYAKATSAVKALNESMKRSSNSSAAAKPSNGEAVALRKQLAETNLFNAKLLYTNKLLQNDALTPRQKVSIIEKLDEARSLREAKLVYESLTRTLTSGKERISEGADRQVLGSASRATRPGSTVSLNEGYEAARWAKLAGISK